MIEELRIRGIGVIEDAEIPLHPGLTVLTGETGAGKTMVLTGLALVTGEKADPRLVRHGCERAEADAVLTDSSGALARWADDAGGVLDDDALLISRVVPEQGRARAFLGGRSVPAAVLSDLAEHYVTIHGQSDQQRLRSPSAQRAALDAAAENHEILAAYREAYAAWTDLAGALEHWDVSAGERLRERSSLMAALGEIDALAPQVGEDDDLRATAERLTNADELRLAAENALSALDGGEMDDGVLGVLGQVQNILVHASAHDDELRPWADDVVMAASALSEVTNELSRYREAIEADPAELNRIHERRAALRELMRKWGPELSDVLAWADEARTRLAAIDAEPHSREELESAVAEAREAVVGHARALRTRRTAAAKRITARVNDELRQLAMKGATFGVAVTRGELGPYGSDEVSMTLAVHPEAPPRPVSEAASGGELSRIMLALEVTLASPQEHTFVFDEVDAGVGGNAAIEVGRRLAALSNQHQVVVVTHLPQVAAYADRHIVVVKNAEAGSANTSVRVLGDAERVNEIARMLAGDESPTALRHAEELLTRSRVGR